MITVKYQVRWDWLDRVSADPMRHCAESEFYISVSADAARTSAAAKMHDVNNSADRLSDLGIEIENLRLVKITEEVVG